MEISEISIEGEYQKSILLEREWKEGRKTGIGSHLFIRSITAILLSVLFPRGTTDLPARNTFT